MFHGEFHERLGVGGTCSVCPIKRRVFAEFFLESFPFFIQEIAKNYSGAFFNEAPDDACSYSPGTTGYDSNLIFQSEPRDWNEARGADGIILAA
jgi:hypothetical protein